MKKPPLEQSIYNLVLEDMGDAMRPLQPLYAIARNGRSLTVEEEHLTPKERQQVDDAMLKAISKQTNAIVNLILHRIAFDNASKAKQQTGEKSDMHANVRLRAGFLYWLDTECEIGGGCEALDRSLYQSFQNCMKRTGIFTATVSPGLFEEMMEYAGATKFEDTWEAVELRDLFADRREFPKFWK